MFIKMNYINNNIFNNINVKEIVKNILNELNFWLLIKKIGF